MSAGLVLPPGEPEAGPWRVAPLSAVVEAVAPPGAAPAGRPWVVGVDGRSASGKTTLAERLSGAVPGAVVVHTDDVAWHHSFFGWADLLVDGVLRPLHAGDAVRYRPPAWEQRSRPGAVQVPRGCPLVVVEGVGVGRRELRPWLDSLVWVQAGVDLAERRGVARDGGDQAAVDFWREWAAEELPLLADQRPWEHAAVVVAGTPVLAHDPVTEVVVAPAQTALSRHTVDRLTSPPSSSSSTGTS